MTIDCTTDGFKSHVIPMPMNKKTCVQKPPNVF